MLPPDQNLQTAGLLPAVHFPGLCGIFFCMGGFPDSDATAPNDAAWKRACPEFCGSGVYPGFSKGTP